MASLEMSARHTEQGIKTMEFTLNVPAVKGRTATTKEYTDEFIGEFVDAWTILSVQPKGVTLSFEFPDAKTRNQWIDNAKTFGETFDTPIRVTRVKQTDSMNPDHGRLTFAMTTVDEHIAKLAAAKAKVDLTPVRTWAKENGHDVNERGRIPAHVQKAYDEREV